MNNIDVLETYETPTDSAFRTAGLVLLVRTLSSGDVTEEWLSPFWAFTEAYFGKLNGAEVKSCRVILGDVSTGTTGISGSGLCAEYSIIGVGSKLDG